MAKARPIWEEAGRRKPHTKITQEQEIQRQPGLQGSIRYGSRVRVRKRIDGRAVSSGLLFGRVYSLNNRRLMGFCCLCHGIQDQWDGGQVN